MTNELEELRKWYASLGPWADVQPHWSLMEPAQENCFFCKQRCPRVTIRREDGAIRKKSCGTRALEYVAQHDKRSVVSLEAFK